LTNEDKSIDVYTTPTQFVAVKSAMEAAGLKPAHAEITFLSAVSVDLDEENAKQMLKLQEMLEDLDDVQNVYSNANIADEYLT